MTSEPGSAAMERIIEEIAKKIARRRMLDGPPSLAMFPVERFEEAFERVWTSTTDLDERQRQNYRADAKIAAAYIETLTRERDEAREALVKVRDGYGPNHLSEYARKVAAAALPKAPTP